MRPSQPRPTYYAVKGGRDGNTICTSWEDFQVQARNSPNATFMSFRSSTLAQRWLNTPEPGPSTQQLPSQRHSAQLQTPTPTQSASPTIPIPQMNVTEEPPEPPPLQLSPEQALVLTKVTRGENVFFTGPAGTGKSVLIREIIRWAVRARRTICVTASTGMAAINIGGTTLHSWSGCGLCKKPAEVYVGRIRQGNSASENWHTEILLIDEVSMIDGRFFDKLEYIARRVRRNNRPFGGIQLVVCGDFFQLPPVAEHNSRILFAFQANSWSRCFGFPVTLHRVFRQDNQEFVDMLNLMRRGVVTLEITERMNQLSRDIVYTDGIEPTDLFPTKAEVAAENQRRMDRLTGATRSYKSHDTPGVDDRMQPVDIRVAVKLLNKEIAPEIVRLKVGCQVMLIKNLIRGELVNGSIGRVVDFFTAREAVNGNTDIGLVDPTNPMRDEAARRPAREADIPRHILDSLHLWPVVDWDSGRRMMMVPIEFTIENVHGEVEATRGQVPLILAWAISIHKSQGQTLQRVRIDLARTFEKGQAYVGLSRATSLDKLQVLNFDPSRVIAHPVVIEWHERNLRQEQQHREFEDEMDTEEAILSYFQGHS